MAISEIPYEYSAPAESGRRRGARLAVRTHCWCEAPESSFYVRCSNISRRGTCLQTLADLDPGTSLNLEISLAGETFQAAAEVVWRRPYSEDGPPPGLGIEFRDVNDKNCRILDEYLSSQA